MNHKGTITIETPRLILRRFTAADAQTAYANWTSDDQVTKFLRWPTHADVSVTQRVVASWISGYADPAFYQWAIELRETGQPIGSISSVGMNEKTDMVHIGYCIGSPWWSKGYTTEALAAVIRFFFEQVGAKRIESQHDPENPASGKVMLKCGMQHEGLLRKADWSNRGIVDASIYSILAEDYQNMSIIFIPASPADMEAVYSLIDARIRWMDKVGIRQWNVTDYWGVYPKTHYIEQMEKGRLYVLRRSSDGHILGTAVLYESDPRWEGVPEVPAYYVHHLATEIGAREAGRTILLEIEAIARRNGKTHVRLDCADDNPRLNRYYEDAGYSICGNCIDGVYTGNLRQKRVR